MRMRDHYGLDGAMIGRASIGYPWFFNEVKHYFKTGEHLAPPTMQARVEAARRHLQMAINWKGEIGDTDQELPSEAAFQEHLESVLNP